MDHLPHIALVGAGQIGSRYLQGLAKINHEIYISVVDPNIESIEIAKERLADITMTIPHKINYLSSIEELNSTYDTMIIATSANPRVEIIRSVLGQIKIKSLILEKVLAQSIKDINSIETMLSLHNYVWVNTPRRAMQWHKQLKSIFSPTNSNAIEVQVTGGRWGLACNAIHFIDLICWWRETYAVSYDSGELEYWINSKRIEFKEVLGTLSIFFADKSRLKLTCTDSDHPLLIKVRTCQGEWTIDERLGIATDLELNKINGNIELQSDITPKILRQILTKNSCELTNLAESASQHYILLQALIEHWNNTHSEQSDFVPIT